MSHFSVPTQGVVALVLGLIALVASRTHHQTIGDQDVYRYPPFVGYLMVGCGILFLCIPLFPGRGDVPVPVWLLFFESFAAAAFAAAVHFFRFRVLVGGSVLQFGTFHFESIPLTEIVDTDVTAGRNAQLFVYLRSGRRLKFSSMLGDFGSLADSIASQSAGPPPGTGASIQKLEDQRARAALNRKLGWIMGIGLATCAIAALTVWWLGA
jgi:hypothetical protein